jgi:hypothetical protein
LLLYYYGYPRLLNIVVKKWNLDRRARDPSIHRRWHPTFHLEMGALRPPVVTFAEVASSQWGLGLYPGLSPFGAFLVEVPLLSTIVASLGYRPPLGGVLPEGCN